MIKMDEKFSIIVVAYNYDFFHNMASENNRKALGVRNEFSYVDAGRLEGSNRNSDYEIFN